MSGSIQAVRAMTTLLMLSVLIWLEYKRRTDA